MASRRYHAFISHASVDHDAAAQICATLEGRGLKCWIAPRDVAVGENYGKAIIEGVRESRALVLVLSAAANDSAAVHNEVEFAFNCKVPCLVIRLEDIAASEELRFFIGARQHVDGFGGALASAAERVAQGIEAMSAAESEASPEPPPAASPEPTPEPTGAAAPEPAPAPVTAQVTPSASQTAPSAPVVAPRSRVPRLAIGGAVGLVAVIGLVLFGGQLLQSGSTSGPPATTAAPAANAGTDQGLSSGNETTQTTAGAEAPDEAADCITAENGQVRNSCAFAVTVVYCGGSTTRAAPECFPLNQPIPGPRVEVPANGSVPDDQQVDGDAPWFFQCRPPAEPVATADNDWRCIAPTSQDAPAEGESSDEAAAG